MENHESKNTSHPTSSSNCAVDALDFGRLESHARNPWPTTDNSPEGKAPAEPESSTLTAPFEKVDMSATPSDFRGTNLQRVTIGIEIEMILRHVQTANYKSIGSALEPLARALNTSCISPTDDNGDGTTEGSRFFQVKGDPTIFPDNGLDLPVEVATPILRNGDWKWVIPEMCRVITTAAKRAGAEIYFNGSTGLHVHIAIDGRPYTLPEVKRVAKAVLIFEKHIDKFHPKCRNPINSYINVNRLCEPLKDLSDIDALAKIDGADSLNSFICIVNGRVHIENDRYRPSRCFKYNYMCLNLYGTIEFRQAIGTVCAEDILRWIKTVAKFVTTAAETPDYLFTEWAQNGIPPIVYGVFGILRPRGMGGKRGALWGRKLAVAKKNALAEKLL